ncbi:hypothetical protein [Streptomyces olivaceus]|uniref:hypothetical protein n=1 Tax=Streptomyces olivaceus TaxID=47716 RepID=UPI003624EC21
MTPTVLGAAVVAASVSGAITLLWWWLSGQGRHRSRSRAALLVPRGAVPEDGPYGTGAIFVDVPPAPSVLPLDAEDREAAGGADPDTVAFLAADTADFARCPAEDRRTPHFLHRDGSRTCCRCETTTAGDQT